MLCSGKPSLSNLIQLYARLILGKFSVMLSAALFKCTYFILYYLLFTEKSKLLLEQNALAMQA